MSFYTPSESQFTRLYRDESAIAFSAMDCLLGGERAIYASTELTTGTRLYNILRETGTKTSAELHEKKGREWFTDHVWVPNVEAAMQFAEAVRQRHGQQTQVVTPAPFTAPGWTQAEYLSFWETLLRTRIKSAWFNRNWQFSNGCTFEFAVACDAGIPTCDSEGQPLVAETAAHQVAEAIRVLDRDGFDTATLNENRNRILATLQPHSTAVPR